MFLTAKGRLSVTFRNKISKHSTFHHRQTQLSFIVVNKNVQPFETKIFCFSWSTNDYSKNVFVHINANKVLLNRFLNIPENQ